MRITSKNIKAKLLHVNQFVLEKSVYKIKHEKHSSAHWLYLHTNDDRRLRTLAAGNSREIYMFLEALQQRYWYMNEPF